MATAIAAHRRQFVVAARPVRELADWVCSEMGDGFWLSHCPLLRVERSTDASGRPWWVLGVAIQSDAGQPDPAAAIAATPTGGVPALADDWGGRFALLAPGRIETDAASLLGCYYRVVVRHDVWVSSSPVLLARLPGVPTAEDPRVLRHPRSMNWFPPPATRYAGVRKLLPTQRLLWGSGRAEVLPRPLAPVPPAGAGYEALLDRFASRLETLARRLPRNRRVWLPLTAGFDSRLLLALVSHTGLEATAYTQEWENLSVGDRHVPKRMAAEVGLEHRVIRRGRASGALERLVDEHTGRHVCDVDRRFIARGQWAFCKPGELALRGGGFELARLHFWRRFQHEPARGGWPTAAELAAGFYTRADEPGVADLAAWRDWVERYPEPAVPWRDRFYIEQRLGGWLSGTEHMLDVTPMDRAYLINCRASFGLLLAMPLDARRDSRPHRDLIARWRPALLEHPVNPKDDAFPRRLVFVSRTRQTPLYPLRVLSRKVFGKAARPSRPVVQPS